MLEKTSKIIQSNHQPIPTMPSNSIPQCDLSMFLNISRDSDSTTSLGSLFQCIITLSENIFFPNTQPEFPLAQLEAIPSCPITVTWEKRLAPPCYNLPSGSCRER